MRTFNYVVANIIWSLQTVNISALAKAKQI